jgi:hypothetical protein
MLLEIKVKCATSLALVSAAEIPEGEATTEEEDHY